MRVIEVEKEPLPFEEENLSPEEKKYRDAVELMESIDCVTRFERAVEALNGAAALFEEIKEYEDSIERAEECRKQSDDIQRTGMQEAYNAAVQMQDDAKTEIDFRTVISEFERFPDYEDSGQRIEDCKDMLGRLAKQKAWINRGIAVLVLVVIALIFWVSPAKPYTKGLIRMKQGHYNMAIKNFKEAENFLNAKNMKKKCRYQQALKAYEAGDYNRAMRLCRLADGREDADILLTRMEIELIRRAERGDVVVFGKGAWQVLEAEGDEMLLLYYGIGRNKIFSRNTNDWTVSGIRQWLTTDYRDKILNQGEKKIVQKVSNDPKGEKEEKLYLLSSEEYARYANIIKPAYVASESSQGGEQVEAAGANVSMMEEWWLRDAGTEEGTVCYVDEKKGVQTNGTVTEKKGVRPVIQILLDEQLLEETETETATPTS